LLNYNESILILNNVSNTIKFIESVEKDIARMEKQKDAEEDWEDLPF